jgi:ribonucleoside-diphosphate reductase alpha chain
MYNAATEEVKQGGIRRGANMGIMRVDHPDILEFIHSKIDGGITNFNISVAITDAFMNALTMMQDDTYHLMCPHTKKMTTISARRVWDAIIECAWKTGDPGLVFIDRINAGPANPTPNINKVAATNPCGEQPLYPWEACNLGSLNVGLFTTPGTPEPGAPLMVSWTHLEKIVRLSVRFLDNVITQNLYPLPQIDAMVKANRRIGLGIMGWADLLYKLRIPYDSVDALNLADKLWKNVRMWSHDESMKLGQERGSFPNFKDSIYSGDGPHDYHHMRNSTVTTIAPTGTISHIANCSSGIEPIFALAFEHRVAETRNTPERIIPVVSEVFEQCAKEDGFYSESLALEIAQTGHLTKDVPINGNVYKTAHEITPEWHVKMQAAFQKHTDNGVSKTINMPNASTVQDVEQAYRLAWETGCNGITVFRDGCKGTQVLNSGTAKKEQEIITIDPTMMPDFDTVNMLSPKLNKRPEVLSGRTHKLETPVGTSYITINSLNGKPTEVFITVGKAGSDTMAVAEGFGRLISLMLRTHSNVGDVVQQLQGIGGSRQIGFGNGQIKSLPDAIARALINDMNMEPIPTGGHDRPVFLDGAPMVNQAGDLCPECGHATFVHSEGCMKCMYPGCGHSEC